MSEQLVKRLRSLADCDSRAGEPLGKCMREAADALEAAKGLAVALEWLADEKTTDELFDDLTPMVMLTPEERVKKIAERKDSRDGAIERARSALTAWNEVQP